MVITMVVILWQKRACHRHAGGAAFVQAQKNRLRGRFFQTLR
jgi:hypothetical protein